MKNEIALINLKLILTTIKSLLTIRLIRKFKREATA